MHFSLIFSLLFSIANAMSIDGNEECCDHKRVGGYDYTLMKDDSLVTSKYGCKNGCIFYRDDTGPAGNQYCFAVGSLTPKCLDTTTTTTAQPTTTTAAQQCTNLPISVSDTEQG